MAADFTSKLFQKLTQEEEVRLEDILVELQVEDDDDPLAIDQEELYEGYEDEEGNAWEATEDIDYWSLIVI